MSFCIPETMSNKPLHVLTSLPAAMLTRVSEEIPGTTIEEVPTEGELPAGTRGDVLLIPPWDPGNLDQLLASGVEWLHTVGTGVDNLPLEKLRGIKLTCSRGASSVPISEWILATILAFEKQLVERWLSSPPEEGILPALGGLRGKTLGLVGLGAIGEATAAHAVRFGMNVIAHRRTARPSPVAGVEIVTSFEDLLSRAQHVVLALPLTKASRHLVNANSLASIPAGAGIHLVNVSRGGLVDQEALRPALEDGRIACATLDVTEPEPPPEGHWLYEHPNVRVSAHVSWSSPDAVDLLLDTFIENLRRRRDGHELHGRVDLEEGY